MAPHDDGPAARILDAVKALPADWPLAGSLRPRVLDRLARHAARRPVAHSAETGTGKSTLLLSQLSAHHVVFALDDTGSGDSLASVLASPLLRRETVEVVAGPTQRTLPGHGVTGPLDFALIDGPHGFPFAHLEYYYLYQHLAPDAVLVLDDVHIRNVNDLFRFVRADAMFELLEVVHTTAFFRRTDAPTFSAVQDGWWEQRYNLRVWPPLAGLSPGGTLRAMVPLRVKERLRAWRRGYVPIESRPRDR